MANGIVTDLPWEDAVAAVQILAATGRTIPGPAWIDSIVAERLNERNEGMF